MSVSIVASGLLGRSSARVVQMALGRAYLTSFILMGAAQVLDSNLQDAVRSGCQVVLAQNKVLQKSPAPVEALAAVVKMMIRPGYCLPG